MSSEGNAQPIIDNPNRKLVKVWSEARQKYNYKYRDNNYYKEYFHKHKKDMTCEHCGKTVTCQMYSHLRSKKCQAIREKSKAIQELRSDVQKLYDALGSVL